MQSALLKAHRSWRRVMLADEPDAYVRRMILNTYLDHRRRRSTTEIPLDCDGPRWRQASSDDHADGVALRSEMWLALAGLPKKQRAVLVLRYYEDCADSAIAALLNCTESTVRSNASRALTALRGTWKDSADGALEGQRHD